MTIRLLSLLSLLTMLAACRSATEITGSWKNPAAESEPLRKIVVMTLNGSKAARDIIENTLSIALREDGYQALQGMEVLPPGITATDGPAKEALFNRLKGSDIDGILTVVLLNEHTEDRFVPGSDRYDPVPRFGYRPKFWGYYSDLYPVLITPAYYQEDKVYFLETNLYAVATEDLLWSAQSRTYSPDDLSTVSRDFAAALLKKMEKDGVISAD